MFISKAEKDQILNRLASLELSLANAQRNLSTQQSQINELKKYRRNRTDEQKAKQAAYMKAYHARKRQEKKDWELIQELAKENTNVSS